MATYAEQLASVQAAIEAIESGAQSIGHDGETYTYADLRTLYAREERLRKKIRGQSRTTRTIAEF